MADLSDHIPMSDADLQELMAKVRQAEEGSLGAHEIAGVSPEELQDFLENKAGIPADEEAQGSPLAAAVSVAYHC